MAFSFDDFFGDEEKKLRIPPLDEVGATGGGGATGAGAMALNCAMMCGSRRILRVSVNSSLLCSILRRTPSVSKNQAAACGTYNSNSCSIRQSRPNWQSGVVTKWIPLFNVQVTAVGCCGSGRCIPFTPTTGSLQTSASIQTS